jgi:hypothetical protein
MLLTCDCVSLEKREGTLGLLFLTDLSGFDIVAGKLTAQVSRSLYCLMAALPALGFCILLGGVGLGDFVMAALGLLNTLFFFATLGVLIFVCVWSGRSAMGWGGLALLVLGALLPILCMALNITAAVCLAWIPAGALLALIPAVGISPVESLLVPHALGWLFIGAASWLAPRCWTPAAGVSPGRPAAATHKGKLLVPTLWGMEQENPFLTTVLLAILCAIALAAALLGPSWMTEPTALSTLVLLHTILKYQAASQAGSMLAGKQRSGELEILLTTPYDEDEILRACLRQLKRGLFWPTLFALGVDLALLILGLSNDWFDNGVVWAAAVVVEVLWMLASLYSLSWVGLFLGLKLGNAAKADGRAIFYVVLLPWVLTACAAGLTAVLGLDVTHSGTLFLFAMNFLFSLVFCNLYFTGSAISELRDRFRFWAART